MEDAYQAAGVRGKTAGRGNQVEQAVMHGVGIDAGTSNLAHDANLLTGSCGDHDKDLRMEEDSLVKEGPLDGVACLLLGFPGEL